MTVTQTPTPAANAQGAVRHANQAPDASRAERHAGFAVASFPIPTGREEEWRFTPMDRLRDALEPVPTDDRGDGDVAAAYDVESVLPYMRECLDEGQAPRGTVLVPGDRAAAAASSQVHEALHVVIPAEQELDEPLRIGVKGKAGRRQNAQYVIVAERHSKATVILTHTGAGTHVGNLEVILHDGADLTVVSSQEWADGAVHLGQHDALVGRDAHYRHIAVTLGGDLVRLNVNARYAGPGGTAECFGVYFADAGQHFEHRLFVDHNEPACSSNVEYKGALQGVDAHAVWVGDVLIRAAAEGTNTYELNRNLLLTEGARADSVPNLEIETGVIEGAGHAAATGRFDDEQLFYLQARGIPESEARRLVVRGFFADIVHRIGVPEVQERLMAAIEAELELSMGAAPATPEVTA